MFWAAPMTPSAGQPGPAKPLSYSDQLAKGSSTLTPASEGGGISSHSHRLDHVEAFSFVSAWDLYQNALAEAPSITVIGSSEDRGAVPEPCVCVRVCACVCANPIEDEPQTASSMIVPREDSQ
jgi:hypothetical protein